MSLVLDGSTQLAFRNNDDISNLLGTGHEARIWVKLDTAPGSGAFYDLFGHDRAESIVQMVTLRITESRTIRVQWVTASVDDPSQNKDTVATIPLSTWTQVKFKIVSFNGADNWTVEVTIGEGSAEQLSPTGAGSYRPDLCTFVGIGGSITSTEVHHSFLDGKIAEAEVFDETPTRIAYWPLLDDANDDEAGALHLSTVGAPSFDSNDHPGGGEPPPEGDATPALVALLQGSMSR